MPGHHHLGTRSATAGRALAATTALALLLTACGGFDGDSGAGGDGSDGSPPDLDGAWELARGTGPDGPVPLVETAPVTLVIEGTRWGGTAACNTYGGDVRIDDGQVTTDGFAVTEMYCMDEDVMESERAYLAALLVVDRVEADAATLVLSGPDTELNFARPAPEPDAALVGTTWELTELVSGGGPDGAVSSVMAEAELLLGEDGRLSGSTGCNRLMGGFTVDGDLLVVDGPLGTTRMVCTDDAAEQERFVLEVFEAGPLTTELSGDQLRLTTADGRGLGYRAG